MDEPKLYRGEPVSFFRVTNEMEVPVVGLVVTPVTSQPSRTIHGLNASVRVTGRPEGWIVRFRSDEKLDKDESYWVQLPNQQIAFRLAAEPKQQEGKFLYEVKIEV